MDIKELLAGHDIWLDKRKGQHFLVDDEILDYEVRLAELKKGDVVLEVGAGIGNLTQRIARKARVIAVEKDTRFLPFLEKMENAEIMNDDIFSVIEKLKFNKVVSNIPYSISQKLLIALLKKEWELAVLVVQKEFASKLSEGKLGAALAETAEVRVVHGVSPEAFFPRGPASSIVILKHRALLDEGYWRFLNKAFRSRNKNIGNVFKSYKGPLAGRKMHQLSHSELRSLYKVVTV